MSAASADVLVQPGAFVAVELAPAGDAVGDRPPQRLVLGVLLSLLGALGALGGGELLR